MDVGSGVRIVVRQPVVPVNSGEQGEAGSDANVKRNVRAWMDPPLVDGERDELGTVPHPGEGELCAPSVDCVRQVIRHENSPMAILSYHRKKYSMDLFRYNIYCDIWP